MTDQRVEWVKNSGKSQILRVLGIALLVFLLQIPIFQIDDLIGERKITRNNAVAEVTQKWGKRQVLQGPLIVVPFFEEVERYQGMVRKIEKVKHYATFLPEHLDTDVTIDSEIRYRSIYGIPLYRAQIQLKGGFDRNKMASAGGDKNLQWEKAELVIAVSDPKSVQKRALLKINGEEFELEPGTGSGLGGQSGFHGLINLGTDLTEKTAFELTLNLGGSDGLYVAPVGRHSSINMASDWKDPSFQGNWLPSDRTVTEEGFNATWEIPYLGRNYPQNWLNGGEHHHQSMFDSTVGVDLVFPLDTYGKTERSIKYELIFIGLTFLGFWLFEILAGVRIHPMQYLLVGGAICLFYLLLLSLAEHIGFLGAYFLAASMIILLVTAYARNVLQSGGRGLLVGGGMSALYLYLLALLQEQEYSLLAGSIGLFVILALVMFLTRKVNWYSAERPVSEVAEEEVR